MRYFKYSGVEWIGQIPMKWELEKVKYHFSNIKKIAGIHSEKYERLALTMKGVVKRAKDDADGLQPSDFNTYQILCKNDLVFKLIDLQNISTSRVGLSPYNGLVSPAYIRLVRTGDLSPEYAEYFFLMMWKNEVFNHLGDCGVRSSLNASDLLNLPICVPPISEQDTIVNFLDEKCEQIDSLTADIQLQIDTLEEYKKSVITEAVTKGLNPDVEMKDSGIKLVGSIPNHWMVLKTGYLFRENVRSANSDDIPLSLSQVDGLISTDEMKERSLKTSSYDGWKHVIKEDLVLNRFKAHLGVMFAATLEGMVSFHYGVYEKRRPLITKYYEYLFHTNAYKTIYAGLSNGMTVGLQNLSNQNFYSTKSLYPPVEEQQEIVDYLDAKCSEIDAIISEKKEQLSTLAEYKKSLIYEYVTGKKEVAAA